MEEELWWAHLVKTDATPDQIADQDQGHGRRTAPYDVWGRVREDYLAGFSARECCERHGVGRSALRERARSEGWRRADQPWTVTPQLDADDEGVELDNQIEGDLDRVSYHQLIHVARRRMMRAVLRNEAVAALRWRRVIVTLEAEQDLEAGRARWDALQRARRSQPETGGRPDSPDSSDSSDPVFESGQDADP